MVVFLLQAVEDGWIDITKKKLTGSKGQDYHPDI